MMDMMDTTEHELPNEPLVGKANILNLPVEMLCRILESLEYVEPDEWHKPSLDDASASLFGDDDNPAGASDKARNERSESIEAIKNCRLVCKAFHDHSSHMLLQSVQVSCFPSAAEIYGAVPTGVWGEFDPIYARITKARAIWDAWVRLYPAGEDDQSNDTENEDVWSADRAYQGLIERIHGEYQRRHENNRA